MATYLLTWNPDQWHWDEDAIEGFIGNLDRNEAASGEENWSTGSTKKIKRGDSFFLIRLGKPPRGICASGRFRSDVYQSPHWDEEIADTGGVANYADIEFDELINPYKDKLLSQELLKKEFPAVKWSPQGSGMTLPDDALLGLEVLWQSHLKHLGVRPCRLVQNREQLRESINVFWKALEDGEDSVRFAAQHPEFFVFDEATGRFAPAKWAALRGITPIRYRALQQIQGTDGSIRGFNGNRTRKHIESLLGREFRQDSGLSALVREQFDSMLGQDAVGKRDLDALRFIRTRTSNKRYWWVNQGKSFEQELEGGFIWAHGKDQAGKSHYYWDNVLEVGVGDTILHYAKGLIRAVSVAASVGYPDDDPKNPDDALAGWRADTRYHLLKTPLPESEVLPIIQEAELTQGPVGETGKVKQGYLFELPEAVAKQLLSMVGETLPPLANKGPSRRLDMDLNLILYGPPGTGKTYTTVERAVAICDGSVPDTREETNTRYRELVEANRIEFVTFHQSYSYEDFVEGIRPVLEASTEDGATANVRYECRSGVFRRICSLATGEGGVHSRVDIDTEGIRFWKMSLGDTQKASEAFVYEDAMENSRIVIGFGDGADYTGCSSAKEIAGRHPREDGAEVGEEAFSVKALDRFKNHIQLGDIVIVSDGNQKFRAVGRVTGDYQHVARESYQHVRPVEWLLVPDRSLPREMIMSKNFSQMTIYELKPDVLKVAAVKELLSSGGTGERGNHVLIIDEINRGNISKILGELVTLLEPDKRLGARNELTVTLPYSGDRFGVPSNLSVVGTMNTADRSIAFLDTALRRRFTFEEMMPQPEVIREQIGTGGVINGVDVADLLSVINDRIEVLYDRDHAIGHAYFLGVDSLTALRQVFLVKVIPLLQEYFYGDYAKICAVLGCPYDDSGNAVSKNKAPMLVARNLGSDLLALADDGYETRVQVEVSNELKRAGEDELGPFFQGVLSVAAATSEDDG